MTPDGWADEGWFRLIQGGQNYLLDEALLSAGPEVTKPDPHGAAGKNRKQPPFCADVF
eukprot:COSAG06_NODE_1803_length_8361_cov_28.682401_10_plen_57_part_01